MPGASRGAGQSPSLCPWVTSPCADLFVRAPSTQALVGFCKAAKQEMSPDSQETLQNHTRNLSGSLRCVLTVPASVRMGELTHIKIKNDLASAEMKTNIKAASALLTSKECFILVFLHDFRVFCSQTNLSRPSRSAQCLPRLATSLLALRAGDGAALLPMEQGPAAACAASC